MDAAFWYSKWDSQQIGFHLDSVNPLLIEYWSSLALTPGSEIFVPLCGKSLDMTFLAEQGHKVLGCELSELAVSQFFDEQQLSVNVSDAGVHKLYQFDEISIYQGDIYALRAEQTANCTGFYDRAALIAWPEEMRDGYARKLAELIKPGTAGLLVTLDYPQETLQGPPFAVSDAWVEQHLAEHFEIEQLCCRDVLADNSRFIKKEVPWLNEAVYRLVRK
ncbi:thiopurine S-methyltransferase [Shewanella corallii]|uniref:Thiopurine S-methyltransferase n=1 Tax=Shewanella corallii TaxID=560080 RepID=A0ABT0N1V5_9GAMM|nr:thiopurine S-methyltransferase [Shewanella corallii]MCL2912418.1 thiopurine S-methyltransferase [Shewanella corallii]